MPKYLDVPSISPLMLYSFPRVCHTLKAQVSGVLTHAIFHSIVLSLSVIYHPSSCVEIYLHAYTPTYLNNGKEQDF